MKLTVLHFSAVGTTLQIARAIAQNFEGDIDWIDLTVPTNRQKPLSFGEHDIVLFAFPVYAGRVVRIPRYYFKQIAAHGALAINVVTYGNRAYDDALLELNILAKKVGFISVASAAFVCEHSFDIGLATGRPDASDIEKARAFAVRSFKLVQRVVANAALLTRYKDKEIAGIPGEFPFKTQFRHDFGGPLVPTTKDTCIDCKKCAVNCPVEAIPYDNPLTTDAERCITCVRCIRRCPVRARSIDLPDFIRHFQWLAKTFQARKEPEMYYLFEE